MSRKYSTPCARELGYEMRIRRERIGLSATDLGLALGWSASKTSRAELGMYRISEVEVTHYLARCGVTVEELLELLDLKGDEERNLGYWMRPHETGKLSNALRSLVYYESTALRSISYEPEFVPGLLQTEDYAVALFLAEGVSERDFKARLQARMDRQQILHRPRPAEFIFFIHEQALRLPVGDYSIMHDQLLHLVFSSARPHIQIRVVPMSAGARSVCRGSFRLFEYHKGHRPLAYLDGFMAGLFVDDEAYLAGYQSLVPKLADIALSEGQSREFLATLASDYDRARGNVHANLAEEHLYPGLEL